jgi:hypothetical protein
MVEESVLFLRRAHTDKEERKMARTSLTLVLALCLLLMAPAATVARPAADWAMNATIIEACSCPQFCQCFFGNAPAGHEEHTGMAKGHFCRFNMAFKVNKGHSGDVKLGGIKFWIGGDLGSETASGKAEWAVLHFDKSVTQEQRDAVAMIVPQLYPLKWGSFQVKEGTIDTWTFDKDSAHATLDGGKTAEVKLKRFQGNTDEPVVMKNLKYWTAPRNDGILMMPNEVEAYRVGDKAFEYKGTNGFMLTIDLSSADMAAAGSASGQ